MWDLRQLRGGLGLFPPCIIRPGKRQPGPFWDAISESLLEICNPDFLTSEQIRSTDLFGVSQEKFLDKWAQKLTKCLTRLWRTSKFCYVVIKLSYVRGEALQKVIYKDSEEGFVSVPFALEELYGKYRKVLLNSIGAGIKDLTKPDVGTLVDATQGGVSQKILLTTHPERPSLAGAIMVADCL